MADAGIKYTFTGNSEDAQAAIAKLEKRYDTLEQKLKFGLGKIKAGGAEGAMGFDAMAASVGKFTSSITGIGGPMDAALKAVDLLKAEWADFEARRNKALDSNRTFAGTLETMAFNTAGDAKYDDLEKVVKLATGISQDTGVGINEVGRALSNAASAKGQLDLQSAADAVSAVLKFMPNSTTTQDVLAGSVLDIRKQFPGASPEDAIGFTAMLGQQARITDPTKVAENAVPAAILMSKIDKGNIEANAALYAAITQATGDVQGRTSRTGGIALAMQLEKALPDIGVGADSPTLDRVRFMQDNPELANQFLNGGGKFKGLLAGELKGPDGEDISFGTDRASFEKKVVPAIRELFDKNSATSKNLDSALAALPQLEGGGRDVYDKAMSALKSNETLSVVSDERRMKSRAELTRIEDTSGARGAAFSKSFDDELDANGFGSFNRRSLGIDRWMREHILMQSPEEASINTLRSAEREAISFGDKEAAEKLDRIADLLTQQLEEARKSKQRPVNRESQIQDR